MDIDKLIEKEFKKDEESPRIILTFNTQGSHIDVMCAYYVSKGFSVKELKTVKKYIFFGEKTYIIIMVAGKGYYEEALKVAVAAEDYEMAAKIKNKIEKL